MRPVIARIAAASALASLCWIAASCGNGQPDGGAGAGGSGGAAGGDGSSGTIGCLKMDMLPVSCPTPPMTYSKVQVVLQARCVSVCHNDMTPDPENPGTTIWGLTKYEHVKDWEGDIRDTVGNCVMPPPDAGVPMTIEERIAILEFIRCGLPQ